MHKFGTTLFAVAVLCGASVGTAIAQGAGGGAGGGGAGAGAGAGGGGGESPSAATGQGASSSPSAANPGATRNDDMSGTRGTSATTGSAPPVAPSTRGTAPR